MSRWIIYRALSTAGKSTVQPLGISGPWAALEFQPNTTNGWGPNLEVVATDA